MGSLEISMSTLEMRNALQDWLRFLVAEAHVLSRDPDLIWQQAANQPTATAVARYADELERVGRWTDRPWLRLVNRPADAPVLLVLKGAMAALSRGTARIVTSERPGHLAIWDGSTLRLLREIEQPDFEVGCVAITDDGSRLICSGDDTTIRVWDASVGLEVRRVNVGRKTVRLALMPGGQFLSEHDDGTFCIWDLVTSRRVATWTWTWGSPSPHKYVTALQVTSDGRHALLAETEFRGGTSASYRHRLTVRDTRTGHVVRSMRGHREPVQSIAVAPDDRHFASGSEDGMVRLWEINSGKLQRSIDLKKALRRDPTAGVFHHDYRVTSLGILPGSETVIVGTQDSSVLLWETRSRRVLRRLPARGFVAATADGSRFVCWDGNALVLDAHRVIAPGTAGRHRGRVDALAISPDGRCVISGSQDGDVRIWDATSGAERAVLHGGQRRVRVRETGHQRGILEGDFARSRKGIAAAAVTADSRQVVCSTLDGSVTRTMLEVEGRRQRLRRGKRRRCIHLQVVTTAAGPRALLAEVAHGYQLSWLTVWDLQNGRKRYSRRIPAEITSVVVNSNGRRMMAFRSRGGVDTFDTETGQLLKSPSGLGEAWSVRIFPDDTRLVSWNGDALEIQGATTGRQLGTLGAPVSTEISVTPDGRRIITGVELVTVWDTTTLQEIGRFRRPTNGVGFANGTVTSDSRYLVSESGHRISVRSVDTGKLLATFPSPVLLSRLVTQDDLIVAGDEAGSVYILQLRGVPVGPRIVAAEVRDGRARLLCPYCRADTAVDAPDLGRAIACGPCGRPLRLADFTLDRGSARVRRGLWAWWPSWLGGRKPAPDAP